MIELFQLKGATQQKLYVCSTAGNIKKAMQNAWLIK